MQINFDYNKVVFRAYYPVLIDDFLYYLNTEIIYVYDLLYGTFLLLILSLILPTIITITAYCRPKK